MNRISRLMKTILCAALLLISPVLFGQAGTQGGIQHGFTFDTNTLLVLFALFLLLPIWLLSNTFITSAKSFYKQRHSSGSARILVPIGLLLMSQSMMAQDIIPVKTPGLSASGMTILLICVICAELFLIIFFATKINDFIQRIESKGVEETEAVPFLARMKKKWALMNFKPIEEEYKLDTGHSYDGIRELDNVIPPWFTTAFLLTIVIGIGYIYRYHFAKSAPMQIE